MKKTLLFILVWLSFGSLNVLAQFKTQKMINHLFTTESGLSSTKITCILQDDRDFLWIGTEDGLNKFNGYDFAVYKKEPQDSLSLISNHITALCQDSRKRIWVGTIAGLEYYDINYNGFINVSLNLPDYVLKNNQCTAIYEDSKGNIWFAAYGYGVVCYSPSTERSVLYTSAYDESRSSVCSNYIRSILEDKEGRIWFASQDNGISFFDPADKTFRHYHVENSSLSSNVVFNLSLRKNGNILISTLRGGLAIYDTAKEEIITYPEVFNNSSTRSIYCALEDTEGNILVGTESNGVLIFDPEKKAFTQHPVFKELYSQIGQSKVQHIYKGNFTYIWFALNYKGVFVTGYEKSGFKTMANNKHTLNSLSYGAVTGITTDAEKNIWVSTDGGGLNLYDRKSQQFKHFRYDPNNKQTISDNAVVTVFCDSKNRVWVGTYTGGLCLYNRDTETFTRFRDTNKPGTLQSDYIRSIREDKNGNLWIGTKGGGLIKFDPEKEVFRTFQKSENPGLASDNINIVFIDSKNRLWIGTHLGLSCMDIDTKSFSFFNQDNGLSNLSIYSIAEDKKGQIWIGTANGLDLYNPEDDTFTKKYPALQEYYSPVINGVVADGDDLWISTNNGLVCYAPETDELKRYFINSGLQSNEFLSGAYYKSPEGEIFFGGVNGLNAFYPQDIYNNDVTPRVYFTNLRVFNELVSINEESNNQVILSRNIEVSDKIKLKQSDKNFTLEFIAMGVYDPYSTIYACKMEGFDDDWIKYDYKHRSITYTNLSPGTYTFRVKASTNPDIWDDKDTSLTIVIEPAIWNTWWAKLSYFILACALLYLLSRFLLARIREKDELRIEKFKINQQKELNESKTNFFMNITHEFRTPLTLTIGPLERLVAENDREKRKQIGQLILRNVTRLQRLINQILDINKIEEQKMLLHVEKIEMVSFVSHTISTFHEITRKKKITLTYTCHPDVITIWYDPDMLDKVLNNLLYNAYKFTEEGGEIHVDIRIDENKDVVMTVKDTGIGMDEETRKHIFERFVQGRTNRLNTGTGIGMNLTKKIVDMHKGNLTVESKEGEGSTFYLTILSGFEHFKPEELVLQKEFAKPAEFVDEENYDQGIPGERPTILLVEDDNDMRYYIRQELEEIYTIEEAVNGRSGLEMAKKIMPDLIVSDVMMPEMDGVELAHLLKADPETSHIPIILLTAQGGLEHRLEGLETGADSYIPKPFSIRYLKIRIRKLIELRRVMKERFSKSINMEAQEVALTSTDEKLLQNAIDYVRSNIENTDLSVEGMSKHLGLSRTHLHRKLKALTGQSPVDFIKMIRMKQAAYLLSTGKLSISEVGYKVGYNTPSYFSSSFHAYFGMSPKAYAEKTEGDQES